VVTAACYEIIIRNSQKVQVIGKFTHNYHAVGYTNFVCGGVKSLKVSTTCGDWLKGDGTQWRI